MTRLHLPRWDDRSLTFCGRRVIDANGTSLLRITDVVDDATCLVCQAGDDRYSRELYRQQTREEEEWLAAREEAGS